MIIQLKQIDDYTVTKEGLYIPHNELEETEGSRIRTRPSADKYYAEGVVLKISDFSHKKFAELGATVKEGDTVLVSKTALGSDTFHFYLDRKQKVKDFKGLIAIPHNLIEATYDTSTN